MVGEVLGQMQASPPPMCCDDVLKRLDKLDDILAALRNMRGDNDKLRGDLADLRNQQNALAGQIAGLPKPVTAPEAQNIVRTETAKVAGQTVDEEQRRNRKFSLLGLDAGPTFGPSRTGDFTASGRARYFSPFGGDGHSAVQAQGEFLYYPGRKEGQFDIGLMNRWGNLQAGGFASFKFIDFKQYQQAGRPRPSRLAGGLRLQPRPGGRFRHPWVQELRRTQQRHPGSRGLPANLRPRGQPAGLEFPGRYVGEVLRFRQRRVSCNCARRTMPGRAAT